MDFITNAEQIAHIQVNKKTLNPHYVYKESFDVKTEITTRKWFITRTTEHYKHYLAGFYYEHPNSIGINFVGTEDTVLERLNNSSRYWTTPKQFCIENRQIYRQPYIIITYANQTQFTFWFTSDEEMIRGIKKIRAHNEKLAVVTDVTF